MAELSNFVSKIATLRLDALGDRRGRGDARRLTGRLQPGWSATTLFGEAAPDPEERVGAAVGALIGLAMNTSPNWRHATAIASAPDQGQRAGQEHAISRSRNWPPTATRIKLHRLVLAIRSRLRSSYVLADRRRRVLAEAGTCVR